MGQWVTAPATLSIWKSTVTFPHLGLYPYLIQNTAFKNIPHRDPEEERILIVDKLNTGNYELQYGLVFSVQQICYILQSTI